MNKYIKITATIFAMSFILIACSNANNEENNNDNLTEENNGDNKEEEQEDGLGENNEEENEENENGPDGPQEVTEEDQEDLEMGDTGKISTTIGDFEMTVKDAKLMDELDGEETVADKLILLDINVKNTSAWPFEMKDMLESTVVTEDLEMSGFSNGAEDFESVDEMEGELEPGEDQDGQFITDVEESDEYYFIQDNGAISAGTTNQAMWTIPVDEIEEE